MSENRFPLVSIIMPTYNSQEFIECSINSILAQSYKNFELLITDDCSNDNTFEIISQYSNLDKRVKVFQNNQNLGAGFSRNNSIKNCNGKYIAFLDSDDLWLPDKLEMQINFMRSENLNFSFTSYKKFSAKGMAGIIIAPKTISYKQMLKGNKIGCLTVIYDAESLGKRYMPLIRKRQDYALWLELLSDSRINCGGLADVLSLYRTDSGMTKNKLSTAIEQWKFYRNYLNLNLAMSFQNFIPYALQGCLKWFK